jgi:hypothetical protein
MARWQKLAIVAAVATASMAFLAIWLHVRHEAQPLPVHGTVTVQQVATGLGATGLADCGPAPLGGVTDSAVAYLDAKGEYIGIDVFPDAVVRQDWEKSSASFGISPIAHGDAWVAYKAVSQSAGC